MLTREEATRDIRSHFDGLYLMVFVGLYAASSFMSALFFGGVALTEGQWFTIESERATFAWLYAGMAAALTVALGAILLIMKRRFGHGSRLTKK